uniref:Uncharacterized protein n=1 Tax=Candidatus Kentrum sp. SD TaxID=2126332 RepID=A0A450YMF5_9GAMM|nr:MAG: hypothetical protein BECKSD772F_GA0070984_102020 [Candidatus Kentron sp. SD]VFK42741.1 MAG: hypothetical protein BECKSD772E_GA0070983_101920 [Candidatus Kentron sp. SD]VFK78227.1 MAG: hypothetical protein BECKSD772D_GA0070982_100939 [Candidatus Kentron sp. SD]
MIKLISLSIFTMHRYSPCDVNRSGKAPIHTLFGFSERNIRVPIPILAHTNFSEEIVYSQDFTNVFSHLH